VVNTLGLHEPPRSRPPSTRATTFRTCTRLWGVGGNTSTLTVAILRANAHLMTIGEPFPSGRTMVLAGHLDRYVVVYPISRSHEVEGLALINWVASVRTADGQPMPPRTETTPRASMTYSRPVAEREAVCDGTVVGQHSGQ
jgi:hypothetical protein